MRKFKKAAAIVLAVAMIFSLMTVNVFAADSAVNVHFILEATPVVDGQFTLNVYVADDASGEIKNPDGYFLTQTQLILGYDDTAVTVEDACGRANAYFKALTVTKDSTVKMASLNASGTEFKGKATPAAVLKCTVKDASKASVTFTPQDMNAKDENADIIPVSQINASPLTVNFGSAPAPSVEPSVAPSEKPTPTPTPTPETTISVSIGNATEGSDLTITIKRTGDLSKEQKVTVKYVIGGTPTSVEVTIPANAKSVPVSIPTKDLEVGQKVNLSVSYVDEDGATQDVELDKKGTTDKEIEVVPPSNGRHHNSNLSTSTNGALETAAPTQLPSTSATPAASAEPTESAAPQTTVFTDVPADYWGYEYIMDLYEDGIINGATATTFLPEANITRAEFTKIAVGVFGLTATSSASQFTDVPASEWFAPYVIAATEAGIVQGISDTEFGPNENITREQMATIIGRQLGLTSTSAVTYTDAAQISDYAKTYVVAMSEAGYLTGDNNQFRPQDNATRAEAATLLDRVYVATKAPATAEPETSAEPEATASVEPETSAEPEATASVEPEASAEPTESAAPEATASADAE